MEWSSFTAQRGLLNALNAHFTSAAAKQGTKALRSAHTVLSFFEPRQVNMHMHAALFGRFRKVAL